MTSASENTILSFNKYLLSLCAPVAHRREWQSLRPHWDRVLGAQSGLRSHRGGWWSNYSKLRWRVSSVHFVAFIPFFDLCFCPMANKWLSDWHLNYYLFFQKTSSSLCMNPSGRAHVRLLSMATDIPAMAAWQESGSPLKRCLKATQTGVSCGAFAMGLCSGNLIS